MMRLLVVAERLGREGGMERYLEVVLPALAARGATIHVLAKTIDAVPAGVVATQLAWADEHRAPDAAAAAATERAVRAARPDAVVAHNVMDAGVVEALRAARRFAYHVHDHRPFCPNGDRLFPRTRDICVEPLGAPCAMHAVIDGCAYGPRKRTLDLIARRERLRDAIADADAVVVASAYVADRTAGSGIAREQIVEIPLPLSDDAFAPAGRAGDPASAADAAPPDRASPPGTVVFAGRVVPQKGLDALVRAAARIPLERRPRVRALGDGPALAAARGEAASLGVALDAPGTQSVAALRAALDEAALLVLPSRWAEPFGYVGIEAFARGRPVVAYDVGGVRTWLDDGRNGIAVARDDVPALAHAIARLLDEPSLRARLGAQARRDAERYRVGPIAERLLSVYDGA